MAAHAIRFEAPRAHPRQALFPSRLGHAKYAHGGRVGVAGRVPWLRARCAKAMPLPAAGRAVETEPEFPSAAPPSLEYVQLCFTDIFCFKETNMFERALVHNVSTNSKI